MIVKYCDFPEGIFMRQGRVVGESGEAGLFPLPFGELPMTLGGTLLHGWDCREIGGARPEEVFSGLYSR